MAGRTQTTPVQSVAHVPVEAEIVEGGLGVREKVIGDLGEVADQTLVAEVSSEIERMVKASEEDQANDEQGTTILRLPEVQHRRMQWTRLVSHRQRSWAVRAMRLVALAVTTSERRGGVVAVVVDHTVKVGAARGVLDGPRVQKEALEAKVTSVVTAGFVDNKMLPTLVDA